MPDCPYAGPVAITEEDKLFGRTREVANVRDLLISERVVLLYSPSGAGKSSLIQAGVAPVMARRGFSVRRVMRVHAEPPPGVECNRYVLSALLTLEEGEGKSPDVARLARMTLSDYFGTEVNGELLLFDQFEEILTVDPMNRPAKLVFFEQLGQLLSCTGRWALFAMREDYLAGLDPYLRYVPTRFASTYRLDLPRTEQAIQAIQGPVNTLDFSPKLEFTTEAARTLTENLSTMMVQNEAGDPVRQAGQHVEPVQLQVVCLRLWNQHLAWVSDPSKPRGITRILPEHVAGDEGIDAALQGYYQDIVSRVSAARAIPERTLRDWFDRNLITDQATRGQVRQRGDERTVRVNAALTDLVNSYLVRSDRRLGSIWYELAHDRLIGPVRANNKAWREAKLSEIERACELWLPGKSSDRLLRGSALDAARAWAQTHQLQPDEAEFLGASEEAEAARLRELAAAQKIAEANRKLKNRNRILIAGIVLGVLVSFIAFVGWIVADDNMTQYVKQKMKAESEAQKAECARVLAESEAYDAAESEKEADQQRELAVRSANVANLGRIVSQSLAEPGDHIDRKILLAIEAWRRDPSHQSFTAIYTAYDLSRRLRGLLHHDTAVVAAAFNDKLGLLVSASSQNGTIRLWNRNLQPVGEPLKPRGDSIVNLAASSTGLLAAAHDDGMISLYQLLDQPPYIQITNASGEDSNRAGGMPLAFSPNGAYLAAGTNNGTVSVFRIVDNARLRSGPDFTPKDANAVIGLAFRPDGKELLSWHGGSTGAFRWDTSDLPKPGTSSVPAITDSFLCSFWVYYGPPQGPWRQYCTGREGLSLRPSVVGAERRIIPLSFDRPSIMVTQFSSGSAAIGADDGAIHLVELPTGHELETLFGHSNAVKSMALGFEDETLATVASNDPRVWVWNLTEYVSNLAVTPLNRSRTQREPDMDGINSVAIGPDAKWLASISVADPRLRLTPRNAPLPATDDERRAPVATPVLSPRDNSSARFQGWRPPIAITPNGKLLLVGDGAGKVTFWDYAALTSGKPDWTKARLREFTAVRYPFGGNSVPKLVSSIAVSHDSKLMAVAVADPSPHDSNRFVIVIYDISDWKAPRYVRELPQSGDTKSVYFHLAFSPKEHILAAGNERAVRVWNLAPGSNIDQWLPGITLLVAFSPDGKTLAAAGAERIRLFDMDALKNSGELRYATALQTPDWCYGLAFSSNGKILAASCKEPDSPQVLLWDMETGQPLGDPIRTGQGYGVAGFAPDGRKLILSSWNSSLATMDLDPNNWLKTLCTRASRNLTLAEWRRYISPTDPYAKTCPDLPTGDLVMHGKYRRPK